MIQAAETVCPQCGALLTAPRQVDTFACPHCRSSLRARDGIGLHRLVEPASITREDAEGFLRAWFSGPEGPADLDAVARYEVGGLRYFPFLRSRRIEADSVVPLASLPAPEVMSLARVPARLLPEGGEGAAPPAARVSPPDPQWIPVDEEMLRGALRAASGDPALRELLLEQRAFYPVHYTYRGEAFSAVIDAGAGRVFSERRPARPEVSSERKVALATMAILFSEAILVPGLFARVVVIAVTALSLYPALRWAAAHHG